VVSTQSTTRYDVNFFFFFFFFLKRWETCITSGLREIRRNRDREH
jgi:hypothetical protein